MIDIKDLRKSFGALEVLRGVSFGVTKGEVLVVLGPSGSGKSTMLRCINFLEDYDGGEIRIDGELVGYRVASDGRRVRRPERENAKLRENVGLVFQSFNLFPHRTALENVMMGPVHVRRMTKREARALALEVLDKVGLAEKAGNYPATLSGGQQQRVAIGRALAVRPLLLLTDEPTGNLDEDTADEVLALARDLVTRSGCGFLMVTHSARLAATLDRQVNLHAGVIA
jgi:ABC-type polar amino acid transport system ATPase subunit